MDLIETKEGILLTVKVTPKAKKEQIVGWENGVLKVKITAAPEKGEANLALIRLLSKTLGIPQRDIILLRGHSSRIKQFALSGISLERATICLKKNPDSIVD